MTLELSSASRGAFSAATKLFAKELTSTPEPEPSELISALAEALAAELPVKFVLLALDAVVEVVDVVAVTMIYADTFYLM